MNKKEDQVKTQRQEGIEEWEKNYAGAKKYKIIQYKKDGSIQSVKYILMNAKSPGIEIKKTRRGERCYKSYIRWSLVTEIFGNEDIGFFAFIANNTRLTCEMLPIE